MKPNKLAHYMIVNHCVRTLLNVALTAGGGGGETITGTDTFTFSTIDAGNA